MKRITIKYSVFVTLAVLLKASYICASEPKTLVQDILTNPANRWKDLHLLPSQLIGSMILHNHPIVSFILDRVHVVTTLKAHKELIESAVFNSSGDKVLTASHDKTAMLWETSSGKWLQTLKGHTGEVYSAAFDGTGDRVLTGSLDKTARLWETSSGKCLRTLKGHTLSVFSVAFDGTGDRVLTGSHDSTARLWETKSGKCLHTLVGHSGMVNSAVFNGSGDLVLTASGDGTARLWETRSGECLHTLVGHTVMVNPLVDLAFMLNTIASPTYMVNSAVFNGSGDLILTGSDDKTAKLWEISSGTCLHTLVGHTGEVKSAVFNGSGDLVLTASRDGTAKLWETRSGECLRTLTGHTDWVNSAVFNGSGDLILTGSDDKTAKLFDISLLPKLRSFFSRNDSISLYQAVVLIGTYEIIVYRKLLRKTVSSHKLYFKRLKDTLKNLSTSTEVQAMSSDRVVFDFRTCPHLQADYEKLPKTVQRILDEYVRIMPSINDCSTASTSSTTDERTLKG